VTIVDDPLRKRGLRSAPFDGEGLPVAASDLVADGVLTSWIAESASARQLGIEPTGHAVRGVAARPARGRATSICSPARAAARRCSRAFPNGILVTELIGQGVNGVTGDYSRGAAGLHGRGGEIAEPVARSPSRRT
jgi:PmbA protein